MGTADCTGGGIGSGGGSKSSIRQHAVTRWDDKIVSRTRGHQFPIYGPRFSQGEVDLPRFREAELGDRLAITLRNIHVPDNVLVQLEKSLLTAYFLYLKQEPAEKAKLLKMVLLNSAIDATTVYPTYRKPFDLIFTRARNEEWRAQGDDFRTFLGDFVAAVSTVEIPAQLAL